MWRIRIIKVFLLLILSKYNFQYVFISLQQFLFAIIYSLFAIVSSLYWTSALMTDTYIHISIIICDLCFYCYKLHLKVTFTTVQSLYAPVQIVYKSKYTDSIGTTIYSSSIKINIYSGNKKVAYNIWIKNISFRIISTIVT